MLENIEAIKNAFIQYKGSGAYITLYLIAIIYLFLKEKDKEKRFFFIYFPIGLCLILFNPIFNKIVGKIITPSLYSRVFWTVPLGLTIAYTCVKVISELEKKKKKIVTTVLLILIIFISGKFIYTSENYTKVGNLYKLPDEHVLIAQLIGVDKEEYKKALVPETMCAHIRQIEPSINLAYKRNPQGYENNKHVIALNSGNTEEITKLAVENECNYIVMKKEIVLTVDFIYFGFEKMNETEKYVIYKKM